MAGHLLEGKRALVTGASSGLGTEFAKQLASYRCHLVLVARREEPMKFLQKELAEKHSIEVDVIAMDLATPESPQKLYDLLKQQGKTVDVLINNAGFGVFGDFLSVPWERQKQMMDLDMITLVHLTKLFAQEMVDRKFGYILQVASIGAYQATPTYSTYSAAKSFVLLFGEALNYELRKTNVSCTVVSPGVTATEFLKVSGQKTTFYQRILMMQSTEVVRIALKAMLKRRSSIIPGFLNALITWSNRFMPRVLAPRIAYLVMKN